MRLALTFILALFAATDRPEAQPFDDLARVEVLPGWQMQDGVHMAGLRITLQPGWKTYWRAPGDAGIPPQFSFAGSDNIAGITPQWPVPTVFDQGGQQAIGYIESVVFPLRIETRDGQPPTALTGQIDLGVCAEICIPVTLDFDAALPPQGQRDAAIVAALINRPLTRQEADIGPARCAIAPIADGLRVTATIPTAPAPQEIVVIEAGNADVWVSPADVRRDGDGMRAVVDMVHLSGAGFALDRSAIRITLLSPGRAVEITGCAAG